MPPGVDSGSPVRLTRRMPRPPLVLGGLFAAGVGLGAFAAWWWLQAGQVAVAPGVPLPAVAPVASRGAEVQVGNGDAAVVLARLDEIASRLRSLEASVQELAASPVRTPAVAPASGAAPVAVDAESLKQALARIERDKLAALSDGELLRRARMIGKDGGDLDAAANGLRLVLERTASSTTRSEVQMQLAMLQRQRETPEALAESAALLQSVVQEQGAASELGMQATYQMVWTASQQRDLTSALAHAERYASAPNAKPNQRAEGRWAAAVVTQKLGSTEQARAAFDGWLQQFGADPELQKLVLDVQTRRAKL